MHIPLGATCATTYQLVKYNKRDNGYPFDWCKISMKQLINVLDNDFKYYEDVIFYKVSDNHKIIKNSIETNQNSNLYKNTYSCIFAHEYNDSNMLRDSLARRIVRFKEIKDFVYFIRIEVCRAYRRYFEELKYVVVLLKKYIPQFKLIIILHESFRCYQQHVECVEYRYYGRFSEDWRYDYCMNLFE